MIETNIIVSVVVATHNRLEYLLKTIHSLCNQSLKNIEIIVVADGHEPNVEICIKQINDERVKYLSIQHCGFPAKPRNVGIKNSTGTFIAFCDDDDVWESDKLEKQVREIEKTGAGLCFTALSYIDQDDCSLPKHFVFRPYYADLSRNKFLLSLGFIPNSSVMIRREVIEKVGYLDENPQLRAVEDYHFWSRILAHYKACFLNEPLVRYRIHTNNIQVVRGFAWLQKQIDLHRSIHRAEPMALTVYFFKMLKVTLYFCYISLKNIGR